MNKLQEFIERLQHAQAPAQQRDVLTGFIHDAGFRYYTYHIAKLSGVSGMQPMFTTNYPDEWVSHYGAMNYIHSDPLVLEGPRHQLPFRWNDVCHVKDLDDTQRQIFSEARDFGITNGLTIPIHGRDGEYAALNLVPDGTPRQQVATLEQQFHLGHLVAFYWHSLAGPRMFEEEGLIPHSEAVPQCLSGRETEVLTWVARGKSTWDIAQILGVSERTVVFHVENAKTKLDASTRTHLVVKAVMEGLIAP